ncbi:Anionic trypsin-2 [Dissostichus eleginoides]|uniref:trypsin n=1 Tax=Dissostichus eleginoides TaxID=100907 RepID=A0AAD9BPF4_DISEL|nr:Anionic trypsin-2 [Dissostichus eleginoides]
MAGMMTGLLLLLLAGVTVGRVVDLQKRIYGGQTCAATERLYHVRLRSNDGKNNQLCGGSLINDQWILTAGHCVPEVGTISVTAFLRVHQDGQTKPVDININDIVRYKEILVPHDIALLKLPKPATGYEVVDLPQCGTRPVEVQIAGYAATGRPTDVNGLSTTLQCAKTDVVKCPAVHCPSEYHYDPKKMFCYQRANVDTRPAMTCLHNDQDYSKDHEHLICYKETGVDITV